MCGTVPRAEDQVTISPATKSSGNAKSGSSGIRSGKGNQATTQVPTAESETTIHGTGSLSAQEEAEPVPSLRSQPSEPPLTIEEPAQVSEKPPPKKRKVRWLSDWHAPL
ncbi:hypothetical protein HJFPF1_13174 [Paramyrothecium foliicola]|nr:hypothetical protein HJFPF1_13174 [Paramyrothecium foliicola]